MAVVNISLITDYDAGVLEGTEAVDARQRARGLRAQCGPDPGGRRSTSIGRFPADLDALGAVEALRLHPRRRPRGVGRGHPPLRDRALADATQGSAAVSVLPIGVCIRTIRAEPRWWLESARRLDEAGYAGVWAWDHFMGHGDPTVPVVESWTILTAAAATTSRVTVGPFVINVTNRHPAVLARMASTLQIVERRPPDTRSRYRRPPGGASRPRHRLPARPRAGRPRRGGRGRPPCPVGRRPGDASVPVLPARRSLFAADPGASAADHHRW